MRLAWTVQKVPEAFAGVDGNGTTLLLTYFDQTEEVQW